MSATRIFVPPARLLIGLGPDADRRAKPLIYQTIEGSILDAYLQFPGWAPFALSKMFVMRATRRARP
jgi:hypothetical protein